MRQLSAISGMTIMLFLVTAMGYYKDDLTRYLLAAGTLTVTVCLVIIKISPSKQKQKTKGYILRG
jgi:hypothetical protein